MGEKIIKSIKKFEIETGERPTHINVSPSDIQRVREMLGLEEDVFEGLEIVEDNEIMLGVIAISKGKANRRTIDYMEMRLI